MSVCRYAKSNFANSFSFYYICFFPPQVHIFVMQYFEKVAERIKDTGVSVRKRAIKIIRDMCISNPNFTQFTTACIEIISRVSDDESSIQVV